MAGIEWIKLATDFAGDSKIRHIRAQKGGDSMALLWTFLLCRAGVVNDGGRVYVAPGVPYTVAGLAAEFGMQRKLVADALRLFEQLGMVRMEPDGLVIMHWSRHQNVAGMERLRGSSEDAKARAREASRRYRERQKEASRVNDASMTPSSDADDADHDADNDASSENDDSVTPYKDIDTETDTDSVEKRYGNEERYLGIDDRYRTSSRARAAAAQRIVDKIVGAQLLDGDLSRLHDVIFEALRIGWTPTGVVATAVSSRGDAESFFLKLQSDNPW